MWIPSVNAIWVRAGSSCAGSAALATNALSTSDLRCRTGSGRADGAADPTRRPRRRRAPPSVISGRFRTHVRYSGTVQTWQTTLLGAEEPGVDPAVTIERIDLDSDSW